MQTRAADKADALNAQLERYAVRYGIALGIGHQEWGNPGVRTPAAPITVIGRIVPEPMEATGGRDTPSPGTLTRLTEKTCILECSRQMGSGCRIPLELEAKSEFAFFPGQIVALEGVNTDGRTFHVMRQFSPRLGRSLPVKEVGVRAGAGLTTLSSAMPPAPPGKGDFSILLAAGPFTVEPTGDRLDMSSFERLLNFCYERRPKVLTLMGPFLDGESEALIGGKVTAMGLPEQIMQREFMGRLRILTSRLPALRVLLVPSPRDLLADPQFPQPTYPGHIVPPTLEGSVLLLPNPVMIAVEGVRISLCSTDVLLPLGMVEYHRAGEGDRLHHLCAYLHQQASVYPLQPALVGVNLEMGALEQLEWPGGEYPDVHVTTSQLRCFARQLDPTLYVNPGQFCRKQAVGTAALLSYSASSTGPDGHSDGRGGKRVEFYQF